MIARTIRAAGLGFALALGAAACDDSTDPNGIERWVADLTTTRQVLFMTLERSGSEVTGTASLASLTNPGSEPLTLTGTRLADSLRITYRRQGGDPFTFSGRYVGPGLGGVLHGAEFVQLAVAFRSR